MDVVDGMRCLTEESGSGSGSDSECNDGRVGDVML